jgi:hypothetical protein
MCSYVSKILSTRTHPCFKLFYKPRFLDIFNRRTRATRPVNIRFYNFISEHHVTLPDVYPSGYPRYSPWDARAPRINMGLSQHKKALTNAMEYQRQFYHFLHNNPDIVPVYIDGSRSASACACAVTSSHHGAVKARLNPMCSAYTAELFAIKLALGGIETGRGSFLICTDSLSALNSISEASTMHPIVQEIQLL